MQTTDPRHGKNAGYQAGCRESCCRTAHADSMAARRKRVYLSKSPDARSALGTQRRVQALMAIGWRQQDIAAAGGWTDKTLIRDILKRDCVHTTTALRIDEVFRKLCMTRGPSSNSREYAARKGWASPLAWNDIDSDIAPVGMLTQHEAKPREADDLIVRAVIDGARNPRGISVADRRAIVRELMQAGHLSRAEIALRCGVSPEVVEMDTRRTV